MKNNYRNNKRTCFRSLLLAFALMVTNYSVCRAQTYGNTLVTNGRATLGSLSGWDASSGTDFQEGTFGFTSPDGGNVFDFYTGTTSPEWISQEIDVSSLSADISAGTVKTVLSSYMLKNDVNSSPFLICRMILEQLNASNAVVATSQVDNDLLSTTSSGGNWAQKTITVNGLDASTRKLRIKLYGELIGTVGNAFVEFDGISLILYKPATVTTQAVSSISTTTATGNGNISSFGGDNATAHGVCWNTGGTPTISDSKTDNGAKSSTGAFTASMTGLAANTTYHVRAFATNTAGTSYGTEVSFTTLTLTTTWNGTVWSPSAPTSLDNVIIDGTYNNAGFSCHDLTINAGKQVTITSGTLAVGGNLNLKSDAANGTATLINSGTLTVGGTTSVEQYLSSARNWYVSSPLSGANAPSGYTYFQYNEPGDNTSYTSPATAYWKSVNAGDGLAIGRGYIAQLTSGTSTITFTGGTLNTGDKTLSLTRTAGKDKEGFNLIGNPYPSYLNIDDLASNTDIEPTYWYRSKASSYVFDTYNIPSGMTTGNSGLAVTAKIPPMQAFWLRVKSGKSTASVVLKNANRGHQDNSNNKFRAPAASNATQKILRLQVSNGTSSDEAVVYFNPNAADEFDAYDSEKMSNNNTAIPEIYTLAGTEKAVINGLNKVTPNKELALGFTTGEANTFTIKATEIGNFDTDTRIILKDKLLNTEQELTSATDYSFSSDPISTASRFSIVFRSASTVTGIDNSTDSKLNLTVFRNENGYITITRNDALGEGTVTVSNALGQKLADCSTAGTNTVVARSFLPGVYLVTVNVSGRTTTKKIILN